MPMKAVKPKGLWVISRPNATPNRDRGMESHDHQGFSEVAKLEHEDQVDGHQADTEGHDHLGQGLILVGPLAAQVDVVAGRQGQRPHLRQVRSRIAEA